MTTLVIEERGGPPAARRRFELVERKGLGHPDTICDRIAEAASRALCGVYLAEAGRVLHHNLDKALLVAGSSAPAFGGGRILAPMRLVLAGRATAEWDGRAVPVDEIALETARDWIGANLRYVRPEEHVVLESALRPGSAQLRGLFAGGPMCANDTSAGVGAWPLTETERTVLAVEQQVNSAAFQARFPEAGEDVKVMGARVDGRLELTVAVAFVDRHVRDARAYLERKEEMRRDLCAHAAAGLSTAGEIGDVELALNTLDRPEEGADGLYLTVLGTSADGADGGQVGRGNRVNGLISFGRPMSLEAAAGKNPVSHVGKIYNLLALAIARHLHAEVAGVLEAEVQLVSRIGAPLAQPWRAAARLALAPGAALDDVEPAVRGVMERDLAGVEAFVGSFLAQPLPTS